MNKLYCPACEQAVIVRGESPSRRAYCTNCGIIMQERSSDTTEANGVYTSSRWTVVKHTSGNNAIREYLYLEDK